MLYITLHNLHAWGKKNMTKAGDICVASELAKAARSSVNVIATSKNDFNQVQDLYNDTRFNLIEKINDSDLSRATDSDVIVVPILEFSDLLDQYRRRETLEFYDLLSKTSAKVVVMNIHHNKNFYLNQIKDCDTIVKDLVSKILRKCVYLVHDPCMKIDSLDSRFVEQIVYFDRSKIEEEIQTKLFGKHLSFYRPASFKGFNIWAKDAVSSDDMILISNVLYNQHLSEQISQLKDKVDIFERFEDYVDNGRSAIISRPYNTESEEFKQFVEMSVDCLNTTDYDYLREQNDNEEVDYLIIENAMLEAVYAGLPLRWSKSSIDRMEVNAASEAEKYNSMDLEEQIEYLSEKFDARKTVEFLENLAK